jgi:hypothetical protein
MEESATEGTEFIHTHTRKSELLMEINEITGQIVDSAIKVHNALGPGLLESAYEACLT